MENDRGESQSMNTIEDAMAYLEEKNPAETPADAQASDDSPEAEEESAEQVDSEEADTEESDDVATDEAEETTLLTLDGKTLEIPKGTPPQVIETVQKMASDLKADYTRKTTEVAQERQQVHAARDQVQQNYQTLQTQAQALAQMAQTVIGQPPSIELAQADPQQYLVAKELFEQRARHFNELVGMTQQMAQQQRAQIEQMQSEVLREQAEKLVKAMPELQNPEKFNQFRDAAIKVGQKYGYSPAEIVSGTDHRALLMLRDLARLEKVDSDTQSVKQKLNNAPPKVSKPGANPVPQKEAKRKEGMREFMKSGRSMRDVERLIRQGKI